MSVFFTFVSVHAQDSIMISDTLSQEVMEKYYSIPGDSIIRHGNYEYHYQNNIMITGKYKMANKAGSWKFISEKNNFIEGNYMNNLKEGKWVIMNGKDTVAELFFEKGKLIEVYSNVEMKKKGIVKAETEEESYSIVENMPRFLGKEMSYFHTYIGNNIHYPDQTGLNIHGKIYISFIVNEIGELEDIKVLKGLHPDFDAEAVRTIQNSPPWYPGFHDGFPVKVKFLFPIVFLL